LLGILGLVINYYEICVEFSKFTESKKMKFKFIYIALVFSSVLGCNKPKQDDTNNGGTSSTKASLYLKYNHTYDGGALELNKDYTDGFGNKISFTRASFYLSQPVIKNDDNQNLTITTPYFLAHSSTQESLVGLYDPTTLSSIKINVGVDENANHADPALYELSHPLAYQSPSMHWGWSSGYLFVVIEGQVDTDGNGTFDNTFTFHLGLDKYLNTIEKNSLNVVLSAGKKAYINLNIDYAKLFTNIDLSTENKTHSFSNEALADKFFANVPTAFVIQ
jgi:hypothetical protein